MRNGVRWSLLGLVAVGALLLGWTGVALLQARTDLTAARDLLRSVEERDEPEAALPVLREAQVRLEEARDVLRQPGPRVVAAVPGVGRTVLAVRAVADAGAATTRSAADVLDAVPERLLVGGRLDLAGAERVEDALREAARRTGGPVERLDALGLTGTPGAVAEAAQEAQDLLGEVPATLRRAADGMAALQGVLGAERERRLLVVLQNNAELRATGGLVSVFAQATAKDGQLELGSFQEVEAVADSGASARAVPAPADYVGLYGPFLANTTLWKNVNMAADVPTSSAVLAEVAAATLPQRPDVVVWVDVPAIAAILRATGPVELPDGSRLTAENAVPRLLSEAYERGEQVAGGQEQRRDELRAAGDAVVRQVLDPASGTSAMDLAAELSSAAAGRHVALWSGDDEEQRLLVAARLAGQVRADGGDLSSFAVHNLGDGEDAGNKLDFYGRRQVSVRVEVGRDAATVEQELAIRNTAPPAGLPTYVAGEASPGRANQLVTLGLPAAAEDVRLTRDGVAVASPRRPLLDHHVLTDAVSIPPGETVRWRLTYRLRLTDGRYRSSLLPQPLAVDAGLLLEVRAEDGRDLTEEPVTLSGPYDEVVRVDVVAQRRPLWTRVKESVRRFWNEPVRLP